MSAAPRPGWYPDPAGTPDLYRWWDGGDWTEAISESPRAPSPRTHHLAGPEDDLPRRRASRFRSAVALVLCLALFLSATVGLGLAIWRDPPPVKRSSGPPSGSTSPDTTPAAQATVGRLDERTREATVGAASMTLPDQPYVLSADPMQVPDLLEVFFLASAPVHQSYDGHPGWSSAVLLGRLSGTAADDEELEDRGVAAVRKLSTTFFRSERTRVKKVTVAQHSVDGNDGVRVTARVHYDIDGLPSRYDRITAIVVGLDDGTMLTAVSAVPDDADDEVRSRAAAALETFGVS